MQNRSLGIQLIGFFLIFAVCMLAIASVTLLFPGSFLDQLWVLNKSGYEQIAPHKRLVGAGFVALGFVMAFAAVGWFKRKLWGWWLAVAIFAANGVGDCLRIISGDPLGGIIGITVAGLILFYLTQRNVRENFLTRTSSE